MRRFPRPREAASFSDSVQHQLNAYSIAATAAGVTVLALPYSAEAKIVYTPAHHVIRERTRYQVDLNHDKKIEFTLSNLSYCSGTCILNLDLTPEKGNGEVGYYRGTGRQPEASALRRGARIGPDARFLNAMVVGLLHVNKNTPSTPFYISGPWENVKDRYLGLRFKIKGRTHYGWARLNVRVTSTGSIMAVLTGYAYETIPGKAITAGVTKGPDDAERSTSLNSHTWEPATLGALAQGVLGLSIWRRGESVAAPPERN